ncbi:MAG: exo-alpha-sialidase [Promethearchaeota archaeon]
MKKIGTGLVIEDLTRATEDRKHAHCSTIVAFPDGELVAGWYWGLHEAHIKEEIFLTRRGKGSASWSEPEGWGLKSPVMFDGNPVMWVAPDTGVLHMFYNAGWGWSAVFLKHKTSTDRGKTWKRARRVYPFISRGVKNPPVLTRAGTYVLPAYVEFKYLRGVFFISGNQGKTWKQSGFVDLSPALIPAGYEEKKGRQVEQPTVIERPDGTLLALFRNDGRPMRKMLKSVSHDGGFTWTPAENYVLPNPAGGFHMITLSSGNVAIIYNHAPSVDNDRKWRNPLSVALSGDGGETWSYRRNIVEWHPDGDQDKEEETFQYPTLVQGPDGTVHATWSLSHAIDGGGGRERVTDIQYTSFTEDWIKERAYFEESWE